MTTNPCRRHHPILNRRPIAFAIACGILLINSAPLRAGPTPVTVNGSTATAQGNQSSGVISELDFDPAFINTLNVNSLFVPIHPGSGVSGISFQNGSGG